MIEAGQHLETDKIVAIDVEYGGGRTVPRIAVTGFNEEVLYYSDFCMRYEDWIETKLTQQADSEGVSNGMVHDFQPIIHYSEKLVEKRPKELDSQGGLICEDDDCSDLSNDEELKAEIAEFQRRVENPQFYEDFSQTEESL